MPESRQPGARPMLLFVCTGNVCRSPIAEYLVRDRLGDMADWDIGPTKIGAIPGRPASPEAVEVMDEAGVDLRGHASRTVDANLIANAAVVVVMTDAHLVQLRSRYPGDEQKMFLLKSFAPAGHGDIADPIGLSVERYREVRGEIEACLPGLFEFMEALEM